MPSIRTFRTFLAVIKHGTFAGAGKEIGLTPAAVGLQIRALEREMKQVFFERGGRSVVLNTAGRQAYARVHACRCVRARNAQATKVTTSRSARCGRTHSAITGTTVRATASETTIAISIVDASGANIFPSIPCSV